ENQLNETVGVDALSRENERSMTARWLSQLSGVKISGALQIAANVDGGQVFVDEKLVGTTGGQPVMVPEIAPGPHPGRVEKTGSKPFSSRVKVSPGEITAITAKLEAEVTETGGGEHGGGEHGGGEVEQPGRGSRIMFWTTLATTAASAAAVVAF